MIVFLNMQDIVLETDLMSWNDAKTSLYNAPPWQQKEMKLTFIPHFLLDKCYPGNYTDLKLLNLIILVMKKINLGTTKLILFFMLNVTCFQPVHFLSTKNFATNNINIWFFTHQT